jgi:hypothetical protein
MMRNLIGIFIAIVVGLAGGSLVNIGILQLGQFLIPPPEGVDMSNMEGLKEAMPQFGIQHFIPPFLAHAIGTLFGAFFAAKIAPMHKNRCAYFIGAFFFLGGLYMVIMLPSPILFSVIDLVFAYFPMVWLALRLARTS